MITELELRKEIDMVIQDLEKTKDEPDLQRHLNSALDTMLWVLNGDEAL